MNKIYFLLLLFAIPLFGETIKIKFDRQWHPKIKGLNHCWVKLVTSKPMALGSKNEDGSIDRHELVLSFTPFAEHYSNSLKITEPLTKKSVWELGFIIERLIGLESVDLLGGQHLFTLETLSWDVETLFIKNNYSVTCKTIERDEEGYPQRTIIEMYFSKN